MNMNMINFPHFWKISFFKMKYKSFWIESIIMPRLPHFLAGETMKKPREFKSAECE